MASLVATFFSFALIVRIAYAQVSDLPTFSPNANRYLNIHEKVSYRHDFVLEYAHIQPGNDERLTDDQFESVGEGNSSGLS
jgi:hypothetical protein